MASTPSVVLGPIGNRATLPQLPLSDCVTNGLLVANTAKVLGIPAGSMWASIVFPADVWASTSGASPTVPAGDEVGTAKFCVPASSGRVVPLAGAADLRIISATAGVFSVEFFV